MRRTFLTNLALVLVLNLLVKPFYILGIDAEVQERVGAEEYGGYAALLSFSFLLNILLDLGITNHNTRLVAQDANALRERVGAVLGIRALLAVVYIIVSCVVGVVIGYDRAQFSVLGVLLVNQVLAMTLLYLRSNIAGAQRYAQDSLLSVLDRLLLIGICAWLLWSGWITCYAFEIEWFIWAQTAAYGAAVLVALFMVRGLGGGVVPQWRPQQIVPVLRESMPYAVLVLLMTVYYRIDTVLLERLLPNGAAEAGIYAQGFRFFEALNMLGFLFAGLLLPMFSKLLKEGGDATGLAALGWRLMLAGCVPVAVAGAWWGREVLELRYDLVTDNAAMAFSLLMCAFSAVGTTYIFGTLLTARGELKALNRMAFGGVVVSLAINALLIPRLGAVGAGIACLATQGATAAVQVFLSVRALRMRIPWGEVARAAGYVLGALLAAWGLARSGWGIVPLLGAFAICCVVLAFGTGFVRLPQLRAFLRPVGRP